MSNEIILHRISIRKARLSDLISLLEIAEKAVHSLAA